MFRSHNSDFMFVANVMYCFEISSRNLKKKRGDIFRHELHGLTLLLYSYDNTKDREFCVIPVSYTHLTLPTNREV